MRIKYKALIHKILSKPMKKSDDFLSIVLKSMNSLHRNKTKKKIKTKKK